MDKQNELQAKEFIETVLIKETERLVSEGFHHYAFVIMAQGLEILGSFLDTKPLKAQQQSKLRFSHAINRLMPFEYREINQKHWLYDKLRASMAHTFTSSRHLLLTSKNHPEFGKKHLKSHNDKLILVAEDFFSAFKKACLRLIDGMDKGFVPQRKIESEFYYTF